MPSLQKEVILFTRYPQMGKCKSRLIPTLGVEGALKLHKQLVLHVLKEVKTFLASENNTKFHIYHDGGTRQQMQQWLGNNHFFKQQGNNLGERMATALTCGLNKNHDTILFGSDCPDINPKILRDGLKALQCNDVVLGPAHDGGYYLIGVAKKITSHTCKKLFKEIPWGTDQVFKKTLLRADTLGLNPHILKTLHDIDTADDLQYFYHCPNPE